MPDAFFKDRGLRMRRVSFTKLLWAALACAMPNTASAAAPVQVAPDIAAQYVRPHQLVDIGGRKLNLFCMGEGGPTVLFDSGLSDWSSIWALVQPAVAKRTRACSYDRAGSGYSDPAQGPRSPTAIVEDMHKLIHSAGLKSPLVLVGHSLGGFNAKLYAALYPADVRALVLVDPAEDRIGDRTRDYLRRRFGAALTARNELLGLDGLTAGVAHYDDCAAATKAHDLDASSGLYKNCTDPVREPLGPIIAAERARLQVTRAYQDAQAAELAGSVYADTRGNGDYAMLFRPGAFGSKPLIVLTHSIYDRKDPLDAADFAAWNEVHVQTAALSRRASTGSSRTRTTISRSMTRRRSSMRCSR
jgi:pimeloyl-ACP methyl ester carboxylesterase